MFTENKSTSANCDFQKKKKTNIEYDRMYNQRCQINDELR